MRYALKTMVHTTLVRHIVARIPKGRVATYGQIAALAGMNGARAVGTILHQNRDPHALPCHRVVNAQGRLAPGYSMGGPTVQRERLAAEGVLVRQDNPLYVDLETYGWKPPHPLRSSTTL